MLVIVARRERAAHAVIELAAFDRDPFAGLVGGGDVARRVRLACAVGGRGVVRGLPLGGLARRGVLALRFLRHILPLFVAAQGAELGALAGSDATRGAAPNGR